ncbi:hypothetical protein BC835DRAFT_1422461 [Cytidiella melzeri]|nr:hypothetical protein BC835DRAFT_1422461 [Cytidiella melzeri]
MVVFAPNFAVLASLAALSAILVAPANGVAIPNSPQRAQSSSDHQANEADKFDKHHADSASSQSTSSQSPESGSGLPLPIPLPGLSRRREPDSVVEKRYDPLDPLLQLGGIYIGDHPRPNADAQAESFLEKSQNSRVRVASSSEHAHTTHHPPGEEVIHMVVTGSDEHIRIGRSAATHHHSDHHDGHTTHEKRQPHSHGHGSHSHEHVIVSGDNDDVHVHDNDKREPRHHHHHSAHRHSNYHWRRDATGSSSLPLVDPTGTILVPLERRITSDYHVNHHKKRSLGGFDGVPGVIDIMSNVAGSSIGQRVASLMLASAVNGTNSTDPFVLNASGTNQTQMYLIVLPDDQDTFDPSGPSSSPSAPTNATSLDGSTPIAQSVDASASVSLGASVSSMNSTLPSNSTAPFKKVALQIPVFDPDEAILKAFCATFDPQPSAPSPLTVESCNEGVLREDHKSQVFSYDPTTGVIQPMWFNGEDDGAGDDDNGEADGNEDSNSGSAATSPTVASAANVASGGADASADVGAAVARLHSLNRELIGDAAGARNFAAVKPQSFAADSYNAQNVTLKFTPAAPVLLPADAQAEQQEVDSSVASSSSGVPTTSSTFSSTTATASGSGSVSGTTSSSAGSSAISTSSTSIESMTQSVAFSPAAASELATSTDSSSTSSMTSTSVVSTMQSVAFSPAAASAMPSGSSSNVASTSSSLSASASISASGMMSSRSSSSGSAAAPTSTASDHGLGVEVFDPSAAASAAQTDSTSSSTISQASSTLSATLSASSAASASSGSAAATMTPVSTSPYEWMFRETTRKDEGN